MKNIRQQSDDSLRPEYKRSDFGDLVQGKHASAQLEFAELVRLLIACIGEDEGLQFVNQRVDHKPGDWTYEINEGDRITLRYWTSELESIDERISRPHCITTLQERSEFQNLLTNHVRILRAKASA